MLDGPLFENGGLAYLIFLVVVFAIWFGWGIIKKGPSESLDFDGFFEALETETRLNKRLATRLEKYNRRSKMGDMAQGGMGWSMAVGVSQELAMSNRLPADQIQKIIMKVGFFEERYGSKEQVISKIREMGNAGYAPEKIFAAIKLLPRGKSVFQEDVDAISEKVIRAAASDLSGEEPNKIRVYNPETSKRAVDI